MGDRGGGSFGQEFDSSDFLNWAPDYRSYYQPVEWDPEASAPKAPLNQPLPPPSDLTSYTYSPFVPVGLGLEEVGLEEIGLEEVGLEEVGLEEVGLEEVGLGHLRMASGDPLPSPWPTHASPTAPPLQEDFRFSGTPAGPEPMTTGQDGGDSPSSNSYLEPSPPAFEDSMSSCAGSPAMPGTPTGAPLPKAAVEVRPASVINHQGRRRRGVSRASGPASTYCCPYKCGGTFTSNSARVRHVNENHGTVKYFYCPDRQCPRSRRGFPRLFNLQVHVKGRKHSRVDLSNYEG
ncbi:hypothetical protein B9Z19DRAFT_219203 [Tuber borchii]|uniref:C2H2-type domain-containing protein n=1 Tax=Tuber borchii TaxID=42251 RepID=A0A2T6ZN29_TUBBO|nr:hypothetical protein B9Z19DRAFT_219203 [Tuber borchii]